MASARLHFLSRLYATCPSFVLKHLQQRPPVDLIGQHSSQSCDSSGVTKQHATHAWWYTVGVVVRCSVGRTASIFVTYCRAASFLDHQNCCRGDFVVRRGLVSLWCPTKLIVIEKFQVHKCWCSSSILVCGMLILSYLYIYFFFFYPYWLKKKKYCSN